MCEYRVKSGGFILTEIAGLAFYMDRYKHCWARKDGDVMTENTTHRSFSFLLLRFFTSTKAKNAKLIRAAQDGDLRAVQRLSAAGAETNAKESAYKGTALIWAVQKGHMEVVDFLLRRGANVHAQAINGATALIIAAQNG